MWSNKAFNKSMSILLALILCLSTFSSALAGESSSSAQPGGGASSGKPLTGSTWSVGSQFMRISLYWAPKAAAGAEGIQKDGADWSSKDVVQIGESFDWALSGGNNPFATVVQHSNFTSARDYMGFGNANKMFNSNFGGKSYYAKKEGYSSGNRVYQISNGALKDNNGTPMNFPRQVGDQSTTTDIKHFFSQKSVQNEILFLLKQTVPEEGGNPNIGTWAMGLDLLESGTYINDLGARKEGAYLLTVEPGIYSPIDGVYSAFTMRDAINWGSGKGTVLKSAWALAGFTAQSVTLEPNMTYKNLGLNYHKPYANLTGTQLKDPSVQSTLRESMGIGAFMFWDKAAGLPVIKYYYDLGDEAVMDDSIGSTRYFVKALTIKEDGIGSTYKAPSTDDGYTLVGASVLSKSEIQGNIKQIPPDAAMKETVFINAKDKSVKFTPEAVDKISTSYKTQPSIPSYIRTVGIVNTNNVKNWGVAHSFATSIQQANKVTQGEVKSLADILKFNTDNTLDYNAGKGSNDLQLTLLYVKGDFKPEDLPKVDTENPIQVYSKGNTTVTYMYFDTPEATTPVKEESTNVPKTSTVTVGDKGDYKVTEWVIVDDKTPNTKEPYPDWVTVKDNVSPSGSTGTTTGDLGPKHWSDPDREIFIRVEKGNKPETVVDSDLYIPERRISWLKSLEDIGGIPTINFSWAEIDGEESHTCGAKKCKGHKCVEGTGDDTKFRFISSNTSAISARIMGNADGFMSYDVNNIHEMNRGKAEGEYNMTPNYGYVIWRGQDVPTIASYKYTQATAPNNQDTPLVKNLLALSSQNGQKLHCNIKKEETPIKVIIQS